MFILSDIPPEARTAVAVEKSVLFVMLFGCLAFLGWLMARHHRLRQEVVRAHLALRDRVVAQAGSLDAFLAFVRTPEGQRLLDSPDLAAPGFSTALRLIQAGIVSMAVSVAGLPFRAWGQVAFFGCAGLGLLIAGLLTRRILRRWTKEDEAL